MPIPESISRHRPKDFGSVELRPQKGGAYYYVYQVSSRWDPVLKKSRKITGRGLGKITPADGFIPNAYALRLRGERGETSRSGTRVRHYAAYEMLRQLTPEIESRLREHFPAIFREINVLTLLRLVDGVTAARSVNRAFLSSYLSDLCPDLATSQNAVCELVAAVGRMGERCEAFMRSFIMPGTTLLFDGTHFFCECSDSLPRRGYNPQHRRDPQVRLLYIFERRQHRPVFYRLLQGSMTDRSAFLETLRSAGCRDCIVVADKGFYSKTNLAALREWGADFILPLRSDTRLIEESFYTDPSPDKWDGAFTYKSRLVYFRRRDSGTQGHCIYVFLDRTREAELLGRHAELAGSDLAAGEHLPGSIGLDRRLGYFAFCSNLRTDAEEIYLLYKERWHIEQCFDRLKNRVIAGPSHAHGNDSLRGWAFLNHVGMLYYYGLINALRSAGLSRKITPDEIIDDAKNVYLIDDGDPGEARVSEMLQSTREDLEKLGVVLLRKN